MHIHDVSISAPVHSTNTDGIDPDSSRNVVIERVNISTGDDCIAIKAGWAPWAIAYGVPTTNVTVVGLTCVTQSACVAIGSEMSGGVADVDIRDVTCIAAGQGLNIKSALGRGGAITNISFANASMGAVGVALAVVTNYRDQYPPAPVNSSLVPRISGVRIADVTAVGPPGSIGRAGEFLGLGGATGNITFLTLERVDLSGGLAPDARAWECANVSGEASDVQPPACGELPPRAAARASGGDGSLGRPTALGGGVNNGLGRRPAMGWNTWCSGGTCGTDVCTEGEIHAVAQALIDSGLAAAGYSMVALDDCWEATERDAAGMIQPDPDRFPSGMAALGEWLHSRDLTFGIYTSLGFSVCNLGGHKTHPPGSFTHETADAKTFASWGVDYLKGDWCDARHLDMQNVTTVMSAAVNASGREIWFMYHCDGTFAPWCPMLGPSSRVSPDHFDCWASTDPGNCGHPTSSGHGTGDIIERLSGVGVHSGAQAGGGWWWADWDLLMIGGQSCAVNSSAHCAGQSDVEYRSEFTFWALASSPLIFATDPRNLTAIMAEVLLNTELISVNQEPNPGVGIGITRLSQAPCGGGGGGGGALPCQLWHRAPGSDGSHYVVLYNPNARGGANVSFGFSFAELGLPATATVALRDVWAHSELGAFTGAYTSPADIQPHEARALRVTLKA